MGTWLVLQLGSQSFWGWSKGRKRLIWSSPFHSVHSDKQLEMALSLESPLPPDSPGE